MHGPVYFGMEYVRYCLDTQANHMRRFSLGFPILLVAFLLGFAPSMGAQSVGDIPANGEGKDSLKVHSPRKLDLGLSASYGISLGDDRTNSYELALHMGYPMSSHLYLGAGLGYGIYFTPSGGPATLWGYPVNSSEFSVVRPFVYGTYFFRPGDEWNPFVTARLGYSFYGSAPFSSWGRAVQSTSLPGTLPSPGAMDTGALSGIYSSIGGGVIRKIGDSGVSIGVGVSLEFRPYSGGYLGVGVPWMMR